jgi:hyaluronan synthase
VTPAQAPVRPQRNLAPPPPPPVPRARLRSAHAHVPANGQEPSSSRSSHTPNRTVTSVLHAALKATVCIYMALVLGFVWLTKDMTFATFAQDPVFALYSIAVVLYVLGRFIMAQFYRPVPDRGHRPTVSVIIPAFNEAEGIVSTIESCLTVNYPADRFEVIVVNDGSTDATWERILDAKARWPGLHAIHLGRNYGKRSAMAEGIRRSRGDILCFVDSDSYLDRDAVTALVQPFLDERVGAVVGHAEVRNKSTNWMTKMQQVRYYSAFRIIKGTESMLSGTVTCASGCCAAYRKSAIMPLLPAWEFQRFLGRPATFGDDRSITNRILSRHRVVYQSTARAETVAPTDLRTFLRQQLRWKKSWLRESLCVVRYFWRKNPIAALFTYASIAFPLMAPWVVLHAVFGRVVSGNPGGLWFYVIGTYAMALLYSLYYAVVRRDGLWFHGLSFVGIYMSVLVFQTYWGILTMRDTRWGTRASTVEHWPVDQNRVVALLPLDYIQSSA